MYEPTLNWAPELKKHQEMRNSRKRERQKECKARERALASDLLFQLDEKIPTKTVPRGRSKGQLPSGRNREQLLADTVELLRALPSADSAASSKGPAASSSVGPAASSSSPQPSSCSGEALLDAMLTSHRERMVVVDLPSWRIRRMSAGFEGEYLKSVFGANMVGQSLMHFVDTDDADRLREYGRRIHGGMGEEARGDRGVEVLLRVFRNYTIVMRRVRMKALWTRGGSEGMFVIEGSLDSVRDPEWGKLNLRHLFGVYMYSAEGSNSAPWKVDGAMKSYGLSQQVGFMGLHLPAFKESDASSSIIDWIKQGAMARLASAQDAVFTFLATRHQVHVMFDTGSSGKLWTQIHVRILLPQMLGGFKTPWGCLLRQPVDGSLVTRMGDVYQVVKLVGHWTGREDEFKFTAFFCRAEDNLCFHTRTWTFTSDAIRHEGQVFKDPLEEPYRYSYRMSRQEEADVTLLGLLGEEHE